MFHVFTRSLIVAILSASLSGGLVGCATTQPTNAGLMASSDKPTDTPTAPTTGDEKSVSAYPVDNPLAATVLGTPDKLKADLPDDANLSLRTLEPLVQRETPATLRYARPLQYLLAAQPEPAPLAFVIAGTGSSSLSSNCVLLSRALYAVGYSVACLPSPTSVTFMLGAAKYPVPGRMATDVDDLYRLMGAVRDDLTQSQTLDITGYALTGYSLGATQAAFVAHKDASEHVFDFQDVLLINPAVDVWRSVGRMDDLLAQNLPGGIDSLPQFVAKGLGELRRLYARDETLRFNRDFLYEAYDSGVADQQDIGAIVGLVFRLALANMAFASDVITHSDVIVPRDMHLGPYDSLEPYMQRSFEISFNDYINRLLVAYWNRDGRHVPKDQLVAEANLHRIADFMAADSSMGVFTNADDPILDAPEVDFLQQTFGQRARIQPHGGHLGNLSYSKTITALQEFFSS